MNLRRKSYACLFPETEGEEPVHEHKGLHRIGLDIGGSLSKMVYIEGDAETDELKQLTEYIKEFKTSEDLPITVDDQLVTDIPGLGE